METWIKEKATIQEILKRGGRRSGVFHRPPFRSRADQRRFPGGNATSVSVAGEFATEQEAIAAAEQVIKHGRPNIGTLIDRATAVPSVHFSLSFSDVNELGRLRDGGTGL